MKLLLLSMFFYSLSAYAIECGPAPKVNKNKLTTYLACAKDDEVIGATYNGSSALFTLATTSACWFEKRTAENIGKYMAITSADKIHTMPIVAGKISGDKIQISPLSFSLCKEIYPGCKEKIDTSEEAPEENMYDFDGLSAEEINKDFGSVMESSMWMTDKRSIVYKDKHLTSGVVTPLPIFTSGKAQYLKI